MSKPAGKPAGALSGHDKAMLLLLFMCVVQFFGAWIYPKYEFGGAALGSSNKTLGVPFQYTLWLFILGASALFYRRRGVRPYVEVLQPFVPFFLIGLVAGAFGIDPFGSVRMLMLWSLMALSAVMLGYSIPPARALRALLWIMFGMLLLSTVWSVAMPSYGIQGGEGASLWRGLFLGKNVLGWIAALVLVVATAAYRPGQRRLPALTIVLALLCLVASGSKGSLVAAVAASAYGYFVPRLMRHVTPGFGTAIVLVGGLCSIVLVALAAPIILDLLGRDITLTGRTIIWKTYFLSMADTPWLGEGPGAYTSLSPITAILANRLNDLGAIATPHNMYLGVLGDAGLFGLFIFLGLMVYMALIVPAYRRTPLWMLSGTVGFLIMVDGMVETHEIFSPGPGWFLLILLRALALQQDQHAQAAAPQPEPVQAVPRGGMRAVLRKA